MKLKHRHRLASTYGLEGSHFRTIVRRRVVDRHASCFSIETPIRNLGNPLVCSIAGFEVHVCGPVVGEVLAKAACCAVCNFGNVG